MSLRPTAPGVTRARVRRLAAAVVVVATTAAVLSGCSGSGSGTQTSADAKQTISFYSWDGAAVMKPIVAGFEKANPNITVNVSYGTPVDGYISALQTRLSSGTAADVFIITAENKVDLMKHKLTEPLNDQAFASTLAPAAKATYTQDGKLYGAAASSWGGGIVYNKDLLAKAGISTAPATWDEFLQDCAALKAKGITPFEEGGDGISVTVAALLGIENAALGGNMDAQIFDHKTTFAKTWTPALTQWSQLFSRGLESKSLAGVTQNQVVTDFEQGKVAMTSTGSWNVGAIQTAAPKLNFGFWAVPGTSSTYWAGAVSPGYAVNAASTHKAAAAKFVSYLVSPAGLAIYQKETASITTTTNFTPTLPAVVGDLATDVRAGKFYLPQVNWPTNAAALTSESTSLLQQLINGQLKPAQVGAQLDQKLSSLGG